MSLSFDCNNPHLAGGEQGTVLKLADRLLESWLEVARSEAASPAAKSSASSPARVGASASLPASTAVILQRVVSICDLCSQQ